jgi:transcription elongation factor Elf1
MCYSKHKIEYDINGVKILEAHHYNMKDLRKEIVAVLEGERIRCPKCGSYDHKKISGLKKQHVGGDDWCQSCGKIFNGELIKELRGMSERYNIWKKENKYGRFKK